MPLSLRLPSRTPARMFLVICAAVVPVALGLIYYVSQQRSNLHEYQRASAQRFVRLAAHDSAWLLRSTNDLLKAIAVSPAITNRNWEVCRQFLSALLANQPAYRDFGILSPTGQRLCNALPNRWLVPEPSVSDRDYFQRAHTEPGMVISALHVGRFTGVPVLVAASAIRNDQGAVEAITYAVLDITVMARSRHNATLFPGADVTILDRHGNIVDTLSNSLMVGQPLRNPAYQALIDSGSEEPQIIEVNGRPSLMVSAARAGTDDDPDALSMIYELPVSKDIARIDRIFWISGAASAVLIALALLVGWAGTQIFVGRNLRVLAIAASRLGQRKFDTRIGKQVSGQEFTDIAHRFDQIATELARQEQQWLLALQRQQGQNRVLQLIAKNQPLGTTLDTLVRVTQAQMEGGCACIMLLDASGQQVQSVIGSEVPSACAAALREFAVKPGFGTSAMAMLSGRRVISTDVLNDPQWVHVRDFALRHNIHTCWSHAIVSPDQQVMGAFTVFHQETHNPSPEELEASRMAAELTAIALDHKRQNEALRYQSQHDALTGVYTREVLSSLIDKAIADAQRNGSRLYVLILDMDGFKDINTTLGHDVGDDLLKQITQRLRDTLGPNCDIARSGGNEFALLLRESAIEVSIQHTVQNLQEQIKRPIVLEGVQLQMSASIGIAEFPFAGHDQHALLRHADSAMYQAKRESSGYAFFDAAREMHTPNRLLLLTELRQALSNDAFRLYFQPKLDLATGKAVGFEALLRWQHPTRGLIRPGDFIPVIELSDLVHPVALWVVDRAVAQCKAWRSEGHNITMAANISARNLQNLAFPDHIREILARHELDPAFLELEITESSIMQDPVRSLGVVGRIRDIGVHIAIDDFGTGHSSLAYLQKLPADNLKIDQSFVMGMQRDRTTTAIVSSIIGLAHNLGVHVTAEGVETQEALLELGAMGCDYAQGYHIARPMPVQEATAWLQKHAAAGTPPDPKDQPFLGYC